jgi:hypothetical protein
VLDQAQQEKEDEAVDNLLAGSKRDLRVMNREGQSPADLIQV